MAGKTVKFNERQPRVQGSKVMENTVRSAGA
jgi:hypothetical protein